MLVFIAGATGVSKISSMSVGLGSEILRFPLVALLQRLARLRPPIRMSSVPLPFKRHLPLRSNLVAGQPHRGPRSISRLPPPNPSVKGTSRQRAAPYVER